MHATTTRRTVYAPSDYDDFLNRTPPDITDVAQKAASRLANEPDDSDRGEAINTIIETELEAIAQALREYLEGAE